MIPRGQFPKSNLRPASSVGEGNPVEANSERAREGRTWKFLRALVAVSACCGVVATAAQAGDLEVLDFSAPGENSDSTPSTTAGARPFELQNRFELNTEVDSEGRIGPSENLKDLTFDLPPGIVGNAAETPTCSQEIVAEDGLFCPAASQVGVVRVRLLSLFQSFEEPLPVYNVGPPPGMAAQFAFRIAVSVARINFHVRTGADYGVTATLHNLNAAAPVFASKVTIWGVPADPSHDTMRWELGPTRPRGLNADGVTPLPYPGPPKTLLSNPTSCGGPLVNTMQAVTWQHPDESVFASPYEAPAMNRCDELAFAPTVVAMPTTSLADSPSGLDFHLRVPQNQDPEGRAVAHLRDTTVALPRSLTVNPSSANGLEACGPGEIGMTTPVGEFDAQFTPDPANCPDASKLGTVEIESPAVIDHPLKGAVYLATPHQNPFNSLLAIYITVDDPESGVVVKLPGLVEADPNTGQLTATVSEAPQLPFEDLTLEFLKGALAPLKTGIACGSYDVDTEMVPWSSPEGATMHPGDSFQITKGAGEGPCVKGEASAPNTPGFEAGTVNTTAGAYSPFVLKLTRADGTQQLTGIDTTLPKGLIAKLAGVQSCSEAALAAAAGHSGKAEQANPSCPEASKLGTVSVGAGAGPKPFYASGTAYLAGPYKGAPLSLAVITPAVAGPFDLGTVVIRNALHIDPETAVVRAVSDPFPSILQGIPLDLRSVVVSLDRSRFIKNPTNCSPFAITGAATALSGQKAPLDNRFQVGDCPKLRFAPKLKLSLKGGTRRSDHPALKAVLSAKEGEANIARTSVALPHSEFLAQNHIKTICTRVQFAADQCPKGSIYGHATATTPLLDQPLTGPVYLRSSNNPLPDLVAALKGPAERPVEVDLVGRIDSFKGGIRTTFAAVPDAPVSRFVLQMQGGKKGLLENSKNLCRSTNRATVQMDGQNGKTYDTRPVLANGCKQGKGKKRAKRHGR
jgi:hypothetical protein